MKYYIIAGEASGDLHASNLMKSIKKNDTEAEFIVWGGDLMVKEGGKLVSHYKERAYMGFVEVARHLPKILGFIKKCKKDILDKKPDLIILVDYPGFNMRIAEFAHGLGIPVYYYISPQVWAWKEKRVIKIKKFVHKLFVVLPFEKDFYKKWNYEVYFEGHPLLDAISGFEKQTNFRVKNGLDERKVIALLPGSRTQEITNLLQYMLGVVKYFTDYQFVIACAPSQPKEMYESIMQKNNVLNVKLVSNQTYQLLAISDAALVTSGTATLETALFEVPQVVLYKSSKLTMWIAQKLVTGIKYISLVNLILDKPAVTELIQGDLSEERLRHELEEILPRGKRLESLKNDYKFLIDLLGNAGASDRIATLIVNDFKNSNPSKVNIK